MKTVPAFFLATLAFSLPARAHHGQEFFLLNDAKVQPPGHGLLQTTFSFADEGYSDSLQLNPGIILGILPRTALSVTANFTEEENESWRYRSLEPSILLDLTPKNFGLPIRFGVSFGYQFADGAAGGDDVHGVTGLTGAGLEHTHTEAESAPGSSATASSSSSSNQSGTEAPHDHSTHDHGTTTTPAPGSGGESNPDALTPEEIAAMGGGSGSTTTPAPATAAPAAASSANSTTTATPSSKSKSKSKSKTAAAAEAGHTHSAGEADGHSHSHENSIHNHDDNLFTSRFTFEADLTKSTLLVGNLICSLPEGGSAAWGYGVGLRQRLRPGLAVGFEALGDFNRHGYQEALGAVYWEPMHHLTLKLGAGTGLSSVSPDATVRAGLIWMF